MKFLERAEFPEIQRLERLPRIHGCKLSGEVLNNVELTGYFDLLDSSDSTNRNSNCSSFWDLFEPQDPDVNA